MSSVRSDANEVLQPICAEARVDDWGVVAKGGWAPARAELYDEKACEAKAWEHLERDGTCGVCQAVCPYTRRAARTLPWRAPPA